MFQTNFQFMIEVKQYCCAGDSYVESKPQPVNFAECFQEPFWNCLGSVYVYQTQVDVLPSKNQALCDFIYNVIINGYVT